MSVVISLSDVRGRAAPRPNSSVYGIGRVAFACDDGQTTRLKDLYQHDPVRVLFPTPPRNEIQSAVFVTTSGGLVGGDVLELTAQVSENAAVQLYPQAAEKVYRSTGARSVIDVTLSVKPEAWLEWLPQETIVFDGAQLHRRTHADVAPGARLLAGEFLVLGRTAMGERVLTGLVRDDWEIHRNGRLVWADALCLDGDIAATVAHPAGLDGAVALATAVYVADDAVSFLETARTILEQAPATVRCAATVVNGILVVRFIGAESQAVRSAYGTFWAAFRHAAGGHTATLPRLWHI